MNKLAYETSPYLLQHADNPVEWFAWGDEALQSAKTHEKPILLSIGYAACHWCHVMAHESFENVKVAQRMNELFINIKIDREERPDLDKVYQQAQQLLTRRSGGWPLTMFLNPHTLLPFYGGTYFPPLARYGLPGFYDLLPQVADYYHAQRVALLRNGNALLEAITVDATPIAEERLAGDLLQAAKYAALQYYDAVNGGFGDAPKFPHVSLIDFLLGFWLQGKKQDNELAEVIMKTLDAMAEGGIYDPLGGGFFRYTVDGEWNIPHFEKMLYDNGALLSLYAHAAQTQMAEKYRRVVDETAGWAMAEMQSPDGGFYASLDADSAGVEGLYYRWNRTEPRSLLNEAEYRLFARYYGLDQTPNFDECWHLRVCVPLQTAAAESAISESAAASLLQQAAEKMRRVRAQRTRPGLDNKILTAWNALMIGGMAAAGRACQRQDYIESAERAFDFLHNESFRDGRLYAVNTAGVARFPAYLDDYAFLLEAGLELVQARWSSKRFQWLLVLADHLLEFFEDKASGGFFFTAHDHEQLINRSKVLMDEAMISGNAAAAIALFKLGHVLSELRYLQAAQRTLQALPVEALQAPDRFAGMMTALALYLQPPEIIILRCSDQAEMAGWLALINKDYRANRLCFAIPDAEEAVPVQLHAFKAVGGGVAYICQNAHCLAPLSSLSELEDWLENNPC